MSPTALTSLATIMHYAGTALWVASFFLFVTAVYHDSNAIYLCFGIVIISSGASLTVSMMLLLRAKAILQRKLEQLRASQAALYTAEA